MFVFWRMEWPHRRKGRIVRVTGLGCVKTRTHRFLFVAMVSPDRVFPMWAVRHLFWRPTHTQSEKATSGRRTSDSPCLSTQTSMWEPLSYTCLVIHSVSLSHTHILLTFIPRNSYIFFPPLSSQLLSPILHHFMLPLNYSLCPHSFMPSFMSFTSFMFIFFFTFSPPSCSFLFWAPLSILLGPIIWPRPPPSPCHYTRWLSCHSVPVATP